MSILFSPAQIGKLELRNHLVMTPMHLGYSLNGEVNDQLIEFYRARARGGVGLIIIGGCGIDRIGNAFGMIQLDDERYIPGLRQLVDAVHAGGAKIVPQLYQAGRYAHPALTGKPSVAPSPIASKLTGQTPEELTEEKIQEIIASFVKAAIIAQKAEFDGVEIIASAGYLISQFLSPVTNQRKDRYGGDLEARMTFGLEVVEAVRKAVGPDYPMIVRVAGNDFVPGSNTNSESRAFCQALEKAGVNALNVTGGWHETQVPQLTMNVPPGTYTYLAYGIKQAVSIPVIACNRINSPELAESILEEGLADFVGMARPLLADPDLPNKGKSGQSDRIRPCIGCNQGCLDNIFRLKPVSCLVNAEAGREFEHGSIGQSVDRQQILVVGAGCAGMEFARVASLRGHKVTIWEESGEAGGQLALAAAPPERQDFLYFRNYLVNACRELGVTIHYNIKATPETILSAVQNGEFERVVIATGARPITPSIKITEGVKVLQAWDVLLGREKTGRNVVIVGGGAVGVDTALLLAKAGTLNSDTLRFLMEQQAETDQELHQLLTRGTKKITVLEMAKGIGRDIGASTRWSMLADLKRHKVNCLDKHTVLEIHPDGVLVECSNDNTQKVIPADTVVLAIGSRSENELYNALQDKLEKISIIGDAAKPRKVLDAIHEAYSEGIK
ncbi:FAD-dependent oxidoreductase [Desulfosporosinus meridiei]|uniref:NADH:flavin oxidoreductase n=1 Tax=Desulfosporosinus meridiei (strain ATCC BAA-275 / DSM 13257 / KCTC 12902 / NCIMB 13706 / S10) TaxID=768704 RepID=J7IYC0_DESMD|nr:FAD-dependent oxidoreductase [Desulfosporosinus meridiei]AFQ43701.1 NADH:flavin oxidoreductase [Desulfosporosinus meridiei DSM 13257]